MIAYIVNISVVRDQAESWVDYMESEHISDVMQTGCFERATMMEVPTVEDEPSLRFRVIYESLTLDSFDEYIEHHAQALKDDHVQRFPEGVSATRETCTIFSSFWTEEDDSEE